MFKESPLPDFTDPGSLLRVFLSYSPVPSLFHMVSGILGLVNSPCVFFDLIYNLAVDFFWKDGILIKKLQSIHVE